MKPEVEAWYHGVITFIKIDKRHPQSAYTGLGTLLQLYWYYLRITITGVRTLMGPIEEALRETFLPAIIGGGG